MTKMKHSNFLKRILLFCLYALPLAAGAQVTINAQLPSGGMMQKEQLWNLSLLNNQVKILEVNIKFSLQDAITNQEVMSASTGSFSLNQGVKLLTNETVQPIFYNYTTPEFSGNFLPIGTYIACYQLYQTQGENEVIVANECMRFTIDPLSPPLLSAPNNKDSLSTPYPFFAWMPPTPINMFSNLTYDLIVTEVIDGQSPAEAIEFNTPVYTNTNLTQPNDRYPESFARLDTGKTYAWQVIARNGFSYGGKTTVWTFTVAAPVANDIAVLNNNYLLLENDLKGTYFISGNQLRIKYTSFDKGHNAPVIFSDASGNVVDSIDKYIMPGDNYFEITLSNLQKETAYTATITDMSGKSQLILISIKK